MGLPMMADIKAGAKMVSDPVVSVEISMPLSMWRKHLEAIGETRQYPTWKIASMIHNVVQEMNIKAEKTYSEEY